MLDEKAQRLLAIGMICFVGGATAALVALTSIGSNWALPLDDSFISFRYADHLAQGYGLRWNLDEDPTEGFSNLLFILVLTPIAWADLDPLLAARIISACATVISASLLTVSAKRVFRAELGAALIPGFALLAVSSTWLIALTGLETSLYTLFALGLVLSGNSLIVRGHSRDVVWFAATAFGACLLRPEAPILVVVVAAVWFAYVRKTRGHWTPGLVSLGLFAVLISTYLGWKTIYFGDVFPNPYYIKSDNLTVTNGGLDAVVSFVSTNALLVLVALLGVLALAMTRRQDKSMVPRTSGPIFWIAGLSVFLYLLFFATTAPLMNVFDRFLYPMIPLLLLISFPVVAAIYSLLLQPLLRAYMVAMPALVMLFLMLSGMNLASAKQAVDSGPWGQAKIALRENAVEDPRWPLAQKFARLSWQPKVAFGDAGIMPYVTELPWLDTVGLNDTFLARAQDVAAAQEYFFAKDPDIFITYMNSNGQFFSGGHGILGDFPQWSTDARWDGFTYVGNVDAWGDISFAIFVKSSAPEAATTVAFLRAEVVDGYFENLPADFGTTKGASEVNWIAQ